MHGTGEIDVWAVKGGNLLGRGLRRASLCRYGPKCTTGRKREGGELCSAGRCSER